MLLRNRVVLVHLELLGLRARVLLRHVEIARVRRRVQTDLDDSRLSHWSGPEFSRFRKRGKIGAAAPKSTRKPLQRMRPPAPAQKRGLHGRPGEAGLDFLKHEPGD